MDVYCITERWGSEKGADVVAEALRATYKKVKEFSHRGDTFEILVSEEWEATVGIVSSQDYTDIYVLEEIEPQKMENFLREKYEIEEEN